MERQIADVAYQEAQMDEPKPILNWVRDENRDVVLTGAVLAGKLVRLQAQWPDWGSYMGPRHFKIRTAPSRFIRGRQVNVLPADGDGPPRTHSGSAWQTGHLRRFGQQQRYYFADFWKNASGPLVVSNAKQYTTEPKLHLQAGAMVGLPYGAEGRLTAEAGLAGTKIMIGATEDPTVRVTIMTTNDPDPRNDLWPYLRPLITPPHGPGVFATEYLKDRFLGAGRSQQWLPVFDNGEHEMVFDVSEDHFEEVTITPEQPYRERFQPFMTAFAVRVEDVTNRERFIISDVVTVEGGFHGSNLELDYPEGSVLFRAV
jgi:hypothetical protein